MHRKQRAERIAHSSRDQTTHSIPILNIPEEKKTAKKMYDSVVVGVGAVAIIMSHPIPFDLTVVSSGYVYVYKVIV